MGNVSSVNKLERPEPPERWDNNTGVKGWYEFIEKWIEFKKQLKEWKKEQENK
jgi:hypothetical protein